MDCESLLSLCHSHSIHCLELLQLFLFLGSLLRVIIKFFHSQALKVSELGFLNAYKLLLLLLRLLLVYLWIHVLVGLTLFGLLILLVAEGSRTFEIILTSFIYWIFIIDYLIIKMSKCALASLLHILLFKLKLLYRLLISFVFFSLIYRIIYLHLSFAVSFTHKHQHPWILIARS